MNKKLINVLNIALVCIVLVMVVVLYYTGKKEHFFRPRHPHHRHHRRPTTMMLNVENLGATNYISVKDLVSLPIFNI